MTLRWRPSATQRDIALLLLIALIIQAPRLVLDLYYPNFDTASNLAAGIDFARSLAEGHLLPRWSELASFGLGEPLNVFYSPLIYYAASFVDLIVGDVWLATKIVNVLTVWAIGVIGYLTLRAVGAVSVALLGAAALEMTPIFPYYLVKSNFMLFGGLFGLALLCAMAMRERAARHIDLVVVASSFLLTLAHSLTMVVMMLSIFGAWSIIRLVSSTPWPQRLASILWPSLSALLGIALAAFHLLPSYLDKVHLLPGWDREASRLAVTMLLPFGAWGGVIRSGLVQWLIPTFIIGINTLTGLWLWRRRHWPTPAGRLALLALTASWLALTLGSFAALPLWVLFKPLALLQFGLRFAGSASIFAILAAAAALAEALTVERSQRWRQGLTAVLAASVLLGVAVFTNYLIWHTEPTPFAGVGIDRFTGNPVLRPATLRAESEGYRANGGFDGACARARVICKPRLATLHDRRWMVVASQPTELVLPVSWFPSWAVRINGQPSVAATDPVTGLVLVHLPPGGSEIRLYWNYSRAERLGFTISYLTAALLTGLMVMHRIRHRPKERAQPE